MRLSLPSSRPSRRQHCLGNRQKRAGEAGRGLHRCDKGSCIAVAAVQAASSTARYIWHTASRPKTLCRGFGTVGRVDGTDTTGRLPNLPYRFL